MVLYKLIDHGVENELVVQTFLLTFVINNSVFSRDPMSLIDQSKYAAASEEEKREMLQKVKPTATRHIFLIRHGQYHFHNEKQNLTDLGTFCFFLYL